MRKIKEQLREQHQVRVVDLADNFGVSKMTIRRDLQDLESRGEIERTHGGAILKAGVSSSKNSDWSGRMRTRSDEKAAIAFHVARGIGRGESLYLSPGSTTFLLARALAKRSDLSIITNSLVAACYLAEHSEANVVVLGGALRRSHLSLARILRSNNLDQLELDHVIVGCEGIHPVYGISNEVPPEYGTDRIVIAGQRKATVIADATKIGKVASHNVAPIENIKKLVTNGTISPLMIEKFKEEGVEVELAAPLLG